jgi:peroxiredoxin
MNKFLSVLATAALVTFAASFAQGFCGGCTAKTKTVAAASAECTKSEVKQVAASSCSVSEVKNVAAAGCSTGEVKNVAAAGCCSTSQVKNVAAAGCCSTSQVKNVAAAGCSTGEVKNVAAAGCCKSEVKNVAAAGCSTGEVKQVADASGCCGGDAAKAAAKLAAGGTCCKATACSASIAQAANVSDMAKGGSAVDNVASGYSLGQRVPNFTLTASDGKTHNLNDFDGKVRVIVFYNQACPFVVEMWDRMDAFTKKYSDKGVQVLAIDPTAHHTQEVVHTNAKDRAFPILMNFESDLAIKFNATRTPEVFILCQNGVIQYHGAFDNGERGVREGNLQTYAENAVNAILKGETPEVRQTRAFGCTIKFNETTLAKYRDS